MTMWANFAKFANPTDFGVYVRWHNFSENDPGVLIIDRSFNMSDITTLNYQGVQFWIDYYPKVIESAMQCCNATSSAPANVPVNYALNHLIRIYVIYLIAILLISNV